jgi:hypothetical protein
MGKRDMSKEPYDDIITLFLISSRGSQGTKPKHGMPMLGYKNQLIVE